MPTTYVHGYHAREGQRLRDQAETLEELLHADVRFSSGERVLEIGCGIGAQTVTLARNSPAADIVSTDVSAESLAAATARVEAAGIVNVRFERADVFDLPFDDQSFDHAFVCFVLEHLPRPIDALRAIQRVLKPAGTITVIEGDHGSTAFHPESAAADAAVQALVELQRRAGGDANIGRRLFPLLTAAGFDEVRVSPRFVYVDGSRPELADGFTRRTFTAMIEGAREGVLRAGLLTADRFDAGVRDLYRTAEADGVFCYTFFNAVAKMPIA